MPLPSVIYDREYFLSDRCEGWERFKRDRGLSVIKQGQVDALAPRAGLRVLDAGCGRGEVMLACAQAGAEVAGIDYSADAVELSRETLAGVPGADVRQGDVTKLPWGDGEFDRVLFADVIEHLDPDQAVAAMAEIRRVLRPGGYVLVHTAPNRNFLRLARPLVIPAMRAIGHGEQARALRDWIAESKRYHVNEQTPRSLRRTLARAGFERPRVWVDRNVLRQGHGHHLTSGVERGPAALAARLAALRPVRELLGNDLYALGWKEPRVG